MQATCREYEKLRGKDRDVTRAWLVASKPRKSHERAFVVVNEADGHKCPLRIV